MNGGGLGQGYHLGTEMLSRGYAVVEPYGTCGAVSRPGMMSTDQTSTMAKGIPGLSGGGKRRSRRVQRGKKSGRKAQRGGRYEAVMSGAEFEALGPRGGMMATAMRAPCEAGQGSALPSPTAITAPAYKGGAQLAPAPFLQEQTAGYTNMPSTWLSSTGAPIQLHQPVGGRMDTPACGQTGGMRGGDDLACTTANNALAAANEALKEAEEELYEAQEAVNAGGDDNIIQNANKYLKSAEANVNIAKDNLEKAEQARRVACNENLPNVFGGRRKSSRKQRKASRKANRSAKRKANRSVKHKASRKQRKTSRKQRK